MIEGENHAKIHDEWQAQVERAHKTVETTEHYGLPKVPDLTFEQWTELQERIEAQQAANEKADRIRGIHEAYKLGNIEAEVFLEAMRKEAGDGR